MFGCQIDRSTISKFVVPHWVPRLVRRLVVYAWTIVKTPRPSSTSAVTFATVSGCGSVLNSSQACVLLRQMQRCTVQKLVIFAIIIIHLHSLYRHRRQWLRQFLLRKLLYVMTIGSKRFMFLILNSPSVVSG